MGKLKSYFMAFLTSGTSPELEVSKKLAIQIANFDVLLSIVTLLTNIVFSNSHFSFPLYFARITGLFLLAFSYYLIRQRYYDSGRYLIHFTGLALIFIGADGLPASSGFEYYYIIGLMTPFVSFSLDELKKSMALTTASCLVFVIQITLGPGQFLPVGVYSLADKIMTIVIVFIYVIAVLAVTRWQVNAAHASIQRQQAELVHSANLIALGEMSGGIAHEINNPLQLMTLNIETIRRKLSKVEGGMSAVDTKLDLLDKTILKIAQMIKGMKDLSRNVSEDPLESVSIKTIMDEILLLSSQKFQNHGIEIKITGDIDELVRCHQIQLSQVFINLLNNSVDAIDHLQEKWITIGVKKKNSFVEVSVTDSGPGIKDEIVPKMMRPFFTTKGPGKGTGLGLSISSSLIEKMGGRLYYDQHCANTRFVVVLPAIAVA